MKFSSKLNKPALILSLASLGLLSACASDTPPANSQSSTPSSVASPTATPSATSNLLPTAEENKTASEILADANANLGKINAYHLFGKFQIDTTNHGVIDVIRKDADTYKGSLTTTDVSTHFIQVGGNIYLQDPATAKLPISDPANVWVYISLSDPNYASAISPLSSFLTLPGLLDDFTASGIKLTKGTPTVLNGVRVIPITTNQNETAYFAVQDGVVYPTDIKTTQGEIQLISINKTYNISAPSDNQVISLADLKALQPTPTP